MGNFQRLIACCVDQMPTTLVGDRLFIYLLRPTYLRLCTLTASEKIEEDDRADLNKQNTLPVAVPRCNYLCMFCEMLSAGDDVQPNN